MGNVLFSFHFHGFRLEIQYKRKSEARKRSIMTISRRNPKPKPPQRRRGFLLTWIQMASGSCGSPPAGQRTHVTHNARGEEGACELRGDGRGHNHPPRFPSSLTHCEGTKHTRGNNAAGPDRHVRRYFTSCAFGCGGGGVTSSPGDAGAA